MRPQDDCSGALNAQEEVGGLESQRLGSGTSMYSFSLLSNTFPTLIIALSGTSQALARRQGTPTRYKTFMPLADLTGA